MLLFMASFSSQIWVGFKGSLAGMAVFLDVHRSISMSLSLCSLPIEGLIMFPSGSTRLCFTLDDEYTQSCITQTCLYQIITYFKGHLLHQKSLH